MLTRETILAKRATALEPLAVPEFDGGTVYVKAMTAAEFKTWQTTAKDLSGEQVAVSLIIAAIVDETGKPLFTADDTPALLAMPNAGIQRLYFAAEDRNIVTKEDARKNSLTRSPA
jgi:hypothetical protein